MGQDTGEFPVRRKCVLPDKKKRLAAGTLGRQRGIPSPLGPASPHAGDMSCPAYSASIHALAFKSATSDVRTRSGAASAVCRSPEPVADHARDPIGPLASPRQWHEPTHVSGCSLSKPISGFVSRGATNCRTSGLNWVCAASRHSGRAQSVDPVHGSPPSLRPELIFLLPFRAFCTSGSDVRCCWQHDPTRGWTYSRGAKS